MTSAPVFDTAFLGLLLLSCMNFSIAAYVYVRDPTQLVNRVFGLVGISIGLWILTIDLAHNPLTSTFFTVRSTFAAASLLLLALLTLFAVFPSSPLPKTPAYRIYLVLGLTFASASYTPFLVTAYSHGPSGLVVTYGVLHPLFGLYASTCLSYGLFILWRKVRTSTGLKRLQLRYLLLGLVVPGIAVAITNLFIPLVFTVSRFGRYGPAFSLVFLALTAHALIRHRLMNIRLVISRGVASVLAALLSGSVFAGAAWLISTLFTSRQWEIPLWLAVGLVFPVAFLFQPIRRFFQVSLDHYLFREPYNYQRTVREASRTIGTMLDLPSLLDYLCDLIGKTLRPERVAIYSRSIDVENYSCIAQRHFVESGDPILTDVVSSSSYLVQALTTAEQHLLRDDVARRPNDYQAKILHEHMSTLGAECAHPIFQDHRLTGFILLGPKQSGDPYFTEDLDLLATLAGQAAVAVKNAQLYSQVVLVNDYIENILATMESGVVAVSSDGAITMFNAAAERMTAFEADLMKGQPLGALPYTLSSPLRASLSDGRPRLQFETVIQPAIGDSMPVICSTSLLKDRAGTVLGAMAVFNDLTKLKKLEHEKQRAERLASIGALASGIAHEIKNPLVAIKTFAELLPERFSDEDFRGDFAKVVINEIDRIDELVARLRSLAPPRTAQLVPLDPRESIDETLSLLRAQLEQGRITVRTAFPTAIPPVLADRAQLKQLFLNLLMNSIEAMEAGGQLFIRIATHEALGGQVVVDIEDTGSGIPAGLLENVFDPFVTTKPRGSGLGLFICRGITDMHHATIRARNNPNGVGTILTIEFPVAHEVAASARLGRSLS